MTRSPLLSKGSTFVVGLKSAEDGHSFVVVIVVVVVVVVGSKKCMVYQHTVT